MLAFFTLTERLESVPTPHGVSTSVKVAVDGVGSGPRVAALAPDAALGAHGVERWARVDHQVLEL